MVCDDGLICTFTFFDTRIYMYIHLYTIFLRSGSFRVLYMLVPLNTSASFLKFSLLMNHSYSWGPIYMFVDCQHFAGSCRQFIISCVTRFVALQCKIIHFFVKRSWGRNSWVFTLKGLHTKSMNIDVRQTMMIPQ